jgi:ribonucleoside-triphosphate reductase
VDASFGLELTVPDFIGNKPAFGLSGKPAGNYKDFSEESQLLASLFLEILSEETAQKPLFNPRLILKIRPSTFVDERAKTILLKAHLLAAERGVPYFANALGENQKHSVFSFSGCRLDSDMSGDWEIDTLRTGCLGVVTVNLPRIAYESGKDQAKFSQIMKERLEMAARALEIKYRMLKQHDKGLLPFLTSSSNGDQYLRLENCSRMVILAGLRETVEAFSGKNIIDEKMLAFAQEMTNDIAAFARKIGDKRGKRLRLALLPSFEASERLAQLDIEKYGIGKVHFSGSRERPFYSTIRKLKIQDGKVSQEQLMTEHGMRDAFAGGELTVIELGDEIYKPEELLAVTKQLAESNGAIFFTYDRKLTYCASCKRSWSGLLHKCPSCGAVDPLRFFDRFAGA